MLGVRVPPPEPIIDAVDCGLLNKAMNNKGIKDQVFTCEACGQEFGFKSYSNAHRFCNVQCAGQAKRNESRELFQQGQLKGREVIYHLLVERDGDKCAICSITEWNGRPIRLWVDHIDGDATNNAPTNFRLVCPNCDSQSETFGARNRGNGRKSRGLPQYG